MYTAEEKAALAMFNFEENKRKEAKILEEMRRLVSWASFGVDQWLSTGLIEMWVAVGECTTKDPGGDASLGELGA